MDMGLRFGIALPMIGRGLGASELITELTEEVRRADEVGLDLVLVPEHHSGPAGSLTDPWPLVSWLLASTSTIHVGTGVLLLPLHSAVRVIEQAALLQNASGGRFVLGIGAGYQEADFDLFDADLASRAAAVEKGIALINDTWHGDNIIEPSLGKLPAPPTWLGAWSPAGVRRAATVDGWIADPVRTIDEVAVMAQRYREVAAENGRSTTVTVMREGWVSETDEAALREYGPAVTPVYRYYKKVGAGGPQLADSERPLDELVAERAIIGSVETVVERMTDLVRRTGADVVVLAMRHPSGPTHERVLEAIELFGRKVVPSVRECL